MEPIKVNLASFEYVDKRQTYLLVGIIAVAVLIISAYNIRLYAKCRITRRQGIVMLSKIINTLLLPVRLVCPHEFVNKLGLRSIRDERCDKVMENCSGRLLDIGCGNNQLVKKYGNDSIGIDVYDFGGGAVIVKDTSKLPFADGSFDAVSFVASINHIPNREDVLRESYRVMPVWL